MKTRFFLLLSTVLFFTGCNIYEQDDYQELVVLEAHAIAGRSLPNVRISKTMPAGEQYSFEDAALNDAVVRLHHIDPDGQEQQVFTYQQFSTGRYEAVNRDYRVQPRHSYRIEVEFDDRSEQLSATTTVPAQFQVLSEVNPSYTYQSSEQLEILLSATESAAHQNIYVINTIPVDTSEEYLTPFYCDLVQDGDAELSDLTDNSSGLINEGNFNINDDQTISLNFPWIGVAFFGENLVVINSVDQNLADLVNSENLQLGGSTLPPGEIPNLIYNVEGGIGVFGSQTTDTIRTEFLNPGAFECR